MLEIVASGRYFVAEISPEEEASESSLLETFNREDTFKESRQYAASKLFVMYAMRQIAKLVSTENNEPDIIVTFVCPGFCVSDLSRGHFRNKLVEVLIKFFLPLLARSTENGSRSIVSGTTLGVQSHSQLWQHDKIQE